MAWCIDHGSHVPDPAFSYTPTALGSVPADTRAAMAWVVGVPGRGTDRVGHAAVMLVLHDLMGAPATLLGPLDLDRLTVRRMAGFDGLEGRVLERARLLKADGLAHRHLRGPLTLSPHVLHPRGHHHRDRAAARNGGRPPAGGHPRATRRARCVGERNSRHDGGRRHLAHGGPTGRARDDPRHRGRAAPRARRVGAHRPVRPARRPPGPGPAPRRGRPHASATRHDDHHCATDDHDQHHDDFDQHHHDHDPLTTTVLPTTAVPAAAVPPGTSTTTTAAPPPAPPPPAPSPPGRAGDLAAADGARRHRARAAGPRLRADRLGRPRRRRRAIRGPACGRAASRGRRTPELGDPGVVVAEDVAQDLVGVLADGRGLGRDGQLLADELERRRAAARRRAARAGSHGKRSWNCGSSAMVLGVFTGAIGVLSLVAEVDPLGRRPRHGRSSVSIRPAARRCPWRGRRTASPGRRSNRSVRPTPSQKFFQNSLLGRHEQDVAVGGLVELVAHAVAHAGGAGRPALEVVGLVAGDLVLGPLVGLVTSRCAASPSPRRRRTGRSRAGSPRPSRGPG